MGGHGKPRSRKLRILLVAYEFPPSPSPQSLRWAYLSGRLAEMGHEVHVMAPDTGGKEIGLPDPGPLVRIHRVYPGPVRALLDRLARRRPLVPAPVVDGEIASSAGGVFSGLGPVEPARLNWKGRLLQSLLPVISWLLFPDLRGEWGGPARRALPSLLQQVRPDVVVTSHEPAVTLLLGRLAKDHGLSWVADLGDPVLAPYTPARWRRRARNLESRTLREADHVLVTTAETRDLLLQRHGGGAPITVVPQGFDERVDAGPGCPRPDSDPLELLYSGSFYAFRDPRPLVEAVLQVPGVRLGIASGNVPGWLAGLADRHPAQVLLLGRVPHRRLLDLQRRVDVLVNIANADPRQVPGKIYEYMGAARPILHLQAPPGDAVGGLLARLERGVACVGDAEAVARTLEHLLSLKRAGRLGMAFRLDLAPVREWSWSELAITVDSVLGNLPSE